MSKFDNLVSQSDHLILTHLGKTLRYTKADTSTADILGIIDLELETYGDNEEIPILTKGVMAKASDLEGWQRNETIQELDDDGELTGAVYKLRELLENDGHLVTIEISSSAA